MNKKSAHYNKEQRSLKGDSNNKEYHTLMRAGCNKRVLPVKRGQAVMIKLKRAQVVIRFVPIFHKFSEFFIFFFGKNNS